MFSLKRIRFRISPVLGRLFLLGITIYMLHITINQINRIKKIKLTESTESKNISPNRNPEPRKTFPKDYNILFHKTHKTGSSSIQNIMYRLALKHNLPSIWDKTATTDLRWPIPFNMSFIINKPGTVRISSAHMKPTEDIYKAFDKNRTLFEFTILRNPFDINKSSYHYYHDKLQICYKNSTSFIDFLENYQLLSRNGYLRDRIRIKSFHDPFCYNCMSHDLGYNKHFWPPKTTPFKIVEDDWKVRKLGNLTLLDWEKARIKEIIDDLDKKLSLALILEHYYESLILLKDALNLSFDDIISFELNRVVSENSEQMGYDISNKDEEKAIREKFEPRIKKFQPIDSAIYDHFYQKFMVKWREYGVERMEKDVAFLKMKNLRMYKKCKVREIAPDQPNGDFSLRQIRENIPLFNIPWHPPKVKVMAMVTDVDRFENPELYGECMFHILPEISMGTLIRKRQIEKGVIEMTGDKKIVRKAMQDYAKAGHDFGVNILDKII